MHSTKIYITLQSPKTVTAYLESKHLLPFGVTRQLFMSHLHWKVHTEHWYYQCLNMNIVRFNWLCEFYRLSKINHSYYYSIFSIFLLAWLFVWTCRACRLMCKTMVGSVAEFTGGFCISPWLASDLSGVLGSSRHLATTMNNMYWTIWQDTR